MGDNSLHAISSKCISRIVPFDLQLMALLNNAVPGMPTLIRRRPPMLIHARDPIPAGKKGKEVAQ